MLCFRVYVHSVILSYISNIEKGKTTVLPIKGHNFKEKFTHKATQATAFEPLDT